MSGFFCKVGEGTNNSLGVEGVSRRGATTAWCFHYYNTRTFNKSSKNMKVEVESVGVAGLL